MSGYRRFGSVRWALCALALVLSGAAWCTDPPDPEDPVEPDGQLIYQYRCAGGKRVAAEIDSSDAEHLRTWVSVEGDPKLQRIEMQQVMAASGFKSSNGKLVWWTKGDEGFLMEEYPPAGSGEMVVEDCRAVSMR